MTLQTREIARSLPDLRRYAQALTGSRRSGDRYVRACLEVIVCEPACVQRENDAKFALFKLFHDILRVTDCDIRKPAGADRSEQSQSREAQRKLKLLVAMGGFSAERATQLVRTSSRQTPRSIAFPSARQSHRSSATPQTSARH